MVVASRRKSLLLPRVVRKRRIRAGASSDPRRQMHIKEYDPNTIFLLVLSSSSRRPSERTTEEKLLALLLLYRS